MRKVTLWVFATVTVLVFSVAAWSGTSPDQEKWHYANVGGYWTSFVAIGSEGNTILGTTSSSSPASWRISSLDDGGHTNWDVLSDGAYDQYWLTGGIAVDSSDNVIAAGVYYDSSATEWGWYVVSYSSAGHVNWLRPIAVNAKSAYLPMLGNMVLVNSIAVDSNDNIIVGGGTYDNLSHKCDGYVVSLNKNGNKNWDYTFSSTSYVQKVAVDSNDNVFLCSFTDGNQGYLATLTSAGKLRWERTLPKKSGDTITLAVDSIGGVAVAEASNGDWFVTYYSPLGTKVWETTADGPGHLSGDIPRGVVFDSQRNVIVAGRMVRSSTDWDMCAISYDASGHFRWRKCHDGPAHDRDDVGVMVIPAHVVAVDPNDNVIVVGEEYNTKGDEDWAIECYSSEGSSLWSDTFDAGVDNDVAYDVAVNPNTGEVVVAGNLGGAAGVNNVYAMAYYGYPLTGYVLTIAEVNSFEPAAASPDPDNGKYLGFGDVVSGGNHFKVEAAFPRYLDAVHNEPLEVKIFIAAQMPDDYSRLAYFDSANNLKYQPPGTLSSWKSSVTGAVAKTTVYSEIDLTFSSIIPSGTHYWYTLVVPATVPDDFSGVDWSTTPWEITVNIFDVK